jgi:hypothetical protein
LGVTITEQAIRSALATDPPEIFRTEVLCQRVDTLNGAIDMNAWRACHDPGGTLGDYRDSPMAWCVDVAPDEEHVTLVGAALMDDGRSRVEVIAAWPSVEQARKALPDVIARGKPQAVSWFPSGPTAAIGSDLRALPDTLRKTAPGRPRLKVNELPEMVPITGAAVAESCQEFASLISARQVVQPADPLLDAHNAASRKLMTGDGWRFMRRDATSHVDATYAAAGAVHTVRNLPPRKPAIKPQAV